MSLKASLSEYIKELSGDQLHILEEIITKKYRKFINFFNLIYEFSDDISKMKYNFSEENVLDIEITLKTTSSKKILKEDLIEDMKTMGYTVDSKVSGKKMKLTITYDESDKP